MLRIIEKDVLIYCRSLEKKTPQSEFVTFPTNSPFIKFEILPKKIPIGAVIDTKSKKMKISFFFFFENK